MSSVDQPSAEAEHEHHQYAGNTIPWYVHLMWIGFWVFVIVYTLRYLVPALDVELVSPP